MTGVLAVVSRSSCSSSLLRCCVPCCFVPLCSSWLPLRSPRLVLCILLPMLCRYFWGVGEDDKMHSWLNYPSVLIFILLLCSSWRSFWSATMTWLSMTWRTCWTARQRRSSPPSPPGSKGQSTPSGPTSSLNPRPPGSGCWRGPWPVRGERNRSAHGGAGTEDALAWNWIGSGPWADLAVSGNEEEEGSWDWWHPSPTDKDVSM